MTVTKCIEVADMLVPNRIDRGMKRRWLGDLEGMLKVELLNITSAEAAASTDEGMLYEDSVLAVPYPYDRMYWLYLMAMIEFTHGEDDHYINTAAMFNAVYTSCAKWLKRGGE